jgi:hypothetical protein
MIILAKDYVHYRDRFKKTIRYCTSCKRVELLPDSTRACPECDMVGFLAFFDTPYHFKRHVTLYKPKMNVIGKDLKEMYDEAMGS